MATIKFLGVHGLGDHRHSPWKQEWQRAVERTFPDADQHQLDFRFLSYDDIFAGTDISAWQATVATGKLLRSGVTSLFRRRARGSGFAASVADKIRWTAGYVVAWVENEEFRSATRERFLAALVEHEPQVVLAHSLGSLVTYEALTHPDARRADVHAVTSKLTYVTLGSQLGNGFVAGNLSGGRVLALDVERWYHLYNRHDDVFTAPIRLPGVVNFQQVDTSFDVDGIADHDAVEYLTHRATATYVWPGLAMLRGARGRARSFTALDVVKPARKPRRRALLVGIDDYPRAADRLEGCVNDVFLISAALQECGFAAEDIRVCLDRRATADAILQRLEWLLSDPIDGDELVFYFSGHGAQLPTYGDGDRIDSMDETLVPWDFDWSAETCVTDDQIFALYSQLPFDTRFVMILDCCHSGGLHRDGGPRARGITPPDDIRHRALRWDTKQKMWVERELERMNRDFSTDPEINRQYFGKDGDVSRLGRGSRFRVLSAEQYEEQKAALATDEPYGPYLPVVIQSCQEGELAFEYRHGVTSHGAFTYALVQRLRDSKRISFRQLVTDVGAQLAELRYDQRPQILGPNAILDAHVPWMTRQPGRATGKPPAKRGKPTAGRAGRRTKQRPEGNG